MTLRTLAIGAGLLLWAAPAAAQERGTVEFGAFGSGGMFDKTLTLNTGFGGGARIGIFLDPRLAIEFEAGEMSASRTLGLNNVNVGILTARAVWTALESGRFGLLLGAGAAASTETNFLHSYGVNALVGAKYLLTDNMALRVDGTADFLANNAWKSFQSLHVGLSFYRSPNVTRVAGSTVYAPGRVDTVQQMRTGRARVDTVRMYEPSPDQLILRVQFETDSTALLAKSLPVLDTIAQAIIATPGSHWEVQGHTDSVGTAASNKILAQGRAQSVVDYLVSKGVDRSILTAVGFGPDRQVFSNSTVYGRAQNRRVQLRRIPPPPTGPAVP